MKAKDCQYESYSWYGYELAGMEVYFNARCDRVSDEEESNGGLLCWTTEEI
jgi:hypothetical protein